MKLLQEMLDLFEKVHTIRNPNVKPRGAPEDKARAFFKKDHNHSLLKKLADEKGKAYHAMEFSDEGDYVMVLMMKAGTYDENPDSEYYGVNVLFYPNGKVEASCADKLSDMQWKKDREAIISAAKKALKDKNLSGIYDGLGGKEHKRGSGKLSVDIPEGKGGAFGVKLGGISAEKNHFGFEDRLNAQKTASALQDAGIKFKRASAGGIFYFDFDSAADLKKAAKIAKSVIDKSVESEW